MADVTIGAELKLTGLSSFKSGLGQADRKASKLRDTLGKVNRKGGEAFTKLGKKAVKTVGFLGGVVKSLAMVTAGLAGVGVATINEFGKFDLQMARLQTVLPAGANAMEQFGNKVLQTSTQFGTSIANVSDAMFQAVSAGVPDKEVERFTKVVGQAAKGGFTEMNTVVDGLTTVINAYGLEVGEARTVSDAFFTANRLGKTTFEELSATIGRVAPTAKALGVSYNELLAATISMTKGGVQTSEVMSSLKQVLANVNKPTKDAVATAQKLGLGFSTTSLKAKGLGTFLNDLAMKTKDNVEAQVALFGSVEAFNAIARLTSDQGLKEFNDGLTELEDSAGATERAFQGVENTVGFKMQQIKSSMGRFAVEIGHGLVQGLGLDQIGDIPAAVEKAATTVRNSAKAFAEGFKEAFAPLQATAAFDWTGLAKTLGSAAANLVNAFMKLAEIIANVISSQGFKDLMMVTGALLTDSPGIGEGRASEAIQKKHGGKALILSSSSPVIGKSGRITGFKGNVAERRRLAIKNVIDKRFSDNQKIKNEGVAAFMDPAEHARQVDREFARLGQVEARTQRKMMADRNRVIKQARDQRVRNDLNRMKAAGKSFLEDATNAVQKGKKVGTDVLSSVQNAWNLSVEWIQNLNVKDKEAKKSGGFSARGRGDATIRSTSEQMYLLTENQIIPMSEEFHFAKLLSEVNS